jgi:hypothetical protein
MVGVAADHELVLLSGANFVAILAMICLPKLLI